PNTFFGLLAPMKDNVAGAKNVAGAFEAAQGLALGPASHAQPPQMPYAPPAPQLAAPAQAAYGVAPSHHPASVPPQPQPQAQPSLPPFNAPGYASVPPPPAGHYGAQPSVAPEPPPQAWGPPRPWS